MVVGVAQKDLPRAIGAPFAREVFGAEGVQVPLPGVEVVHLQREMIAAVVREHGFGAVANDVQLLIGSEPEPRARKREGRARDWLEPEDLMIKPDTLLYVADVNGDVVQFLNLRGNFVCRFGPTTTSPKLRNRRTAPFTLKRPASGRPNASIVEKSPSCPGL